MSTKPRTLKTPQKPSLSDEGDIVFPLPIAFPSDSFPPDFSEDSDLVVDPYGNFYCFVCQVSVPKGSSNISQHLSGKKHDANNRRFNSPEYKDSVRIKVLAAAKQQRMDFTTPAQVAVHVMGYDPSLQNKNGVPVTESLVPKASSDEQIDVVSNLSADQETTVVASEVDLTAKLEATVVASKACQKQEHELELDKKPKENLRKVKRNTDAKRLRSISIDKTAFLESLVCDSDDDDFDLGTQYNKPGEHANLESRESPFGPLTFMPPAGPDYFFESMAEETKPSEASRKIKAALVDAVNSKQTTNGGGKTNATEAGEHLEQSHHRDTDDSLYIGSDKEKRDIDEEAERKAKRLARESLVVLRDENGEELPPWLLDRDVTEKVLVVSDSSVSLHFEILEFCRFVSPTAAELESRSLMIVMVRSIVSRLWPSSTVQVFGSYATDLYLPASDIDLCVLGTPAGGDLKEFEELAQAVRNVKGFARRVNVIKAKVNLVKIIARKTSMNCDISIGVSNGPKYVPVIKKYVESFPALRPLLLVVKCFLQQRDLNEVYSGGLGSYTVLLLVVSHLQMLRYNFPNSKANLGSLLQQFLQLYGRLFNFCIAGIQVKENGMYFDKFDKYQTAPQDTMRFSVEDPNDETNELGRNGFAAARVRKAFGNASHTLINWRRDDATASPTPLGSILKADEMFQRRRKSVIEDLESKGQHPLRESLKVSSKTGRSGQSPGVSKDSDVLPESEKSWPRRNDVGRQRRPFSPGRRRERDPRLAKRRRSSTRMDTGGRDVSNPNTYNAGEVEIMPNGPPVQSGSATPFPVGSVQGIYDSTMPYGNPSSYPDQQPYSVATPGYQYAEPTMFISNNTPSGQVYPPQNFNSYPQQIPQHGRNEFNNTYGPNHSRGNSNRRGRSGKRGSFYKRAGQRNR